MMNDEDEKKGVKKGEQEMHDAQGMNEGKGRLQFYYLSLIGWELEYQSA